MKATVIPQKNLFMNNLHEIGTSSPVITALGVMAVWLAQLQPEHTFLHLFQEYGGAVSVFLGITGGLYKWYDVFSKRKGVLQSVLQTQDAHGQNIESLMSELEALKRENDRLRAQLINPDGDDV